MCLHPDYGRGMVTPLIPWLGESARAVWEHHERWDGGGYPAGLAGLDIALAARIVAVADTFDVMTSARSYKARSRRPRREPSWRDAPAVSSTRPSCGLS